ncbi:hypothetical protein [Rufibacter sp. LB8]|uniref:hypothetical protein n=1 Tax=Rufibacter sp. LB8 TaxID=2777781 RepID=UPI00178C6B6D|nr:hypothetical protein [Rufibacter sp. LB8]
MLEDDLDTEFKYYFSVLDSVAAGKKQAHQLKHEHIAFLYLIDSWTGTNVNVDHTGFLKFKSSDLQSWISWYEKKKGKIDKEEYQKAFGTYMSFLQNGITDAGLEYLMKISEKYRALY